MSRIKDLDTTAIHVLRRLIFLGEDVPIAAFDLPKLSPSRDALMRAGYVTRSRNGKSFELTALGAQCRGDIFQLDHGIAAKKIARRKEVARMHRIRVRAGEIFDALKELAEATDSPDLDSDDPEKHALAECRVGQAYDDADKLIKTVESDDA